MDLGDSINPVKKLPQYNPLYSVFFNLTKKNYNHIRLNHKNRIIDLNCVWYTTTNEIKEEIFTKFSPLLDPIR